MEHAAIRVIISSSENGESESIMFTEDWNSSGTDLMPRGQTIDNDKTVSFEMPTGFPVDCVLVRS